MANQKYKIELTALDKTKKAFSSVKKGLGAVKSGAVGVTKVLGGATIAFGAAATAVALLTKTSFDYIDAIGKTSLRTGLAVNSLQAYVIAAQESGSSTEEATKGFEKFARSIGDAERGLKTQQDIFLGLGVAIRDTDGAMRSTEDILKDTADGIKKLGSESERATVLANLFGRAGLKFSEIFRNGSVGLESFKEKAKSLGIVLDSQIIENVQQFNDSFNILSNQFNSFKNNILGALAPVLNAVVEDLSSLMGTIEDGDGKVEDLGKEFKDLGEILASSVLTGIAGTIRATGELIKGVQNFAAEAEIGLNNLKLLVDPTTFEFIKNALLKNNVELGVTIGKILAGADATTELTKRNAELETQINTNTNVLEGAAVKVEGYAGEIGKAVTSNIALTAGIGATNDGLDEQNQKVFDMSKPLEVYQKSLEEVTKFTDQNTVKAFQNFENVLVDFARTGEADFKSFTDSVIKDLIRLQIRMTIIKPFFEAFETAGGFGKGGLRSGFNALFGTSFDNGGFTGNGIRAGGIDGKGGFPAILHPNETVIDHTKGQQAAQAQPVSINFSIQATDAAGVDEIIASRKNQIVAMVSQAMNQRGKVGLV